MSKNNILLIVWNNQKGSVNVLTMTEVHLPASQQSRKAPYALVPKGICIHNTANDASALAEISYMQSNAQYTSFAILN